MEIRRISNDELYHHGIKGQKWGVRRYQNPDGTLTAAGKDKYGSIKKFKKLQKKQEKQFNKEGWTAIHNNANKTFNSELTRINSKKEYKNAVMDDEEGREFASEIGQKYVKEVSKAWKKSLEMSLNDQVTNKYETLGKEYLEYAKIKAENIPTYYQYDSFIDKER